MNEIRQPNYEDSCHNQKEKILTYYHNKIRKDAENIVVL